MKALVLNKVRGIEIMEVPEPRLVNDNDVLLRLSAAGICGSDIHYYKDGRIGDQVVNYPFTIGHECSAIVEKVGRKVERLKPGNLVAIDPAISCGKCNQCLSGRNNTCSNLLFLGCPGQLAGCFAEFIVMPEENCYLLPVNITAEQGAFIEPLSIGCYTVSLLGKGKIDSMGILGVGPIGLSVILAAREKGIKTIYATDKLEDRLLKAKQIGACWTGNADKSDIVNEIKLLEPNLLDVVVECCGKQEAMNQAIDLLKPGGMLLVVGIPEFEQISFDINKLRRKEITIENVRRQNNCINKAIKLVNQFPEEIDSLITHRYPFAEISEAFELVSDYKDGVIKAMIQF